ncbi:uncharacterized protein LDX57_005907 [Aspergillus melleus]|uniref:uncharacterized protein n=1 Tax=Aspergillus melleus TaxID=138277 RepID=UPI001E8CEA99|nr:uncharacterized protein LDX57_005907 [Aspergillus melleus]KAH8428202.1 hypothetical protein LDX57_005907 [Aspergillus melleus]
MKNAFKALATVKPVFSDAPKDSRYLNVEYYFGTLFKDILREHTPQEEQPVNFTIQEVPWSSYSEEAPRDLVEFIEYAT